VKRCIKQWLVGYELDELAKRSSFDLVAPEQVLGVLHQLAGLHLDSASPARSVSQQRLGNFRNALLRIWELANDQQRKNELQHGRWRRVMAICNGLYPTQQQRSRASLLAFTF
jgi:hypothetical protein